MANAVDESESSLTIIHCHEYRMSCSFVGVLLWRLTEIIHVRLWRWLWSSVNNKNGSEQSTRSAVRGGRGCWTCPVNRRMWGSDAGAGWFNQLAFVGGRRWTWRGYGQMIEFRKHRMRILDSPSNCGMRKSPVPDAISLVWVTPLCVMLWGYPVWSREVMNILIRYHSERWYVDEY